MTTRNDRPLVGVGVAVIDQGRILGERNRPVTADDVLILVQKRGALFQENAATGDARISGSASFGAK